MPDVDSLAFDIRFALAHKAIGDSARKFVRSLSEGQKPISIGFAERSLITCAAAGGASCRRTAGDGR